MINNDAVTKCVNEAAMIFHKRQAGLSAVEKQYADHTQGTLVTCTLTGYHSSRKNQVIEVKLNDEVIDRVIIANLRMKHKCNFRHIYGIRTRSSGM